MKSVVTGPVTVLLRNARTLALRALLCLLGAAPSIADGETITRTFVLNASDFDGGTRTGAACSFTVTWDPATSTVNARTGIVENSNDVSYAGPLVWTYLPAFDTMFIGGAAGSGTSSSSGANFVDKNTDDFRAEIAAAAGLRPALASFSTMEASSTALRTAR